MNVGYLYCVYSNDGKKNKFFNEFLVSYKSLKRHVPNCNVSLYTNITFPNIYGINHIIYDKDIDKSHIAKAVGLLKTRYDKTIFLDTDIIIHRPMINNIFKILDEFDFTCCFGNSGQFKGTIYPDLNTGLLGVKKNGFTKRNIQNWILNFRKGTAAGGAPSDQIYFRMIFMRHKRNFYTLPTYFMYRWHMYRNYPKQAVLTHSHKMSKIKVTKQIINTWQKETKT